MQDRPRKHHFIPQFYLAGFTMSGTRDGRLHVLDQKRCRQWQSTPENTAHQRDYYAIDVPPGEDSAAVERALSQVESQCSQVVSQMVMTRSVPGGSDRDLFLNFVAMMAVRVPKIRNRINAFADDVIRSLGKQILRRPGGWEYMKEAIKVQGGAIDDSRRDEFVSFVEGDQYDISIDQPWHVGMMVEMVGELLPLLAHRQWSLWIAKDDVPDLIASDSPVSLFWTEQAPGLLGPGFGTTGTTLTVPLSRRVAVVSTFEGQPDGVEMSAMQVARINSATALSATQLYSPDADFIWCMAGRGIAGAPALMDALRKRRDESEQAAGEAADGRQSN